MAKTKAPLFSIEARGTIGKTTIYTTAGATTIAKAYFKPTYKRTATQNNIRNLFKEAITKWTEAYKRKWGYFNEIGVDVIQLWNFINTKTHRMGRCEFLSDYIIKNGGKWEDYPLPLRINKLHVTDKIQNYEQTISDLETLTGLTMCTKPTVIKLDIPLLPEAGFAIMPGLSIGLNPDLFTPEGYWIEKFWLTHELTHCLLMQHGYYNFFFIHNDHETMANECAKRVAERNLTPTYTYEGKTMSEIVPSPTCS